MNFSRGVRFLWSLRVLLGIFMLMNLQVIHSEKLVTSRNPSFLDRTPVTGNDLKDSGKALITTGSSIQSLQDLSIMKMGPNAQTSLLSYLFSWHFLRSTFLIAIPITILYARCYAVLSFILIEWNHRLFPKEVRDLSGSLTIIKAAN